MNLKPIILSALLASSMWANAANTITVTEQVTSAVTVADDVDYTITGTTPFATAGSVNITNTDHAVVIFANIRPSKVIASYLGNVLINGEKAVNGTNCQVKMYGAGAIVFPYAKNIKPLTVYDEQNCTGNSCNDYGLENSGGYMNTMTDAKFNNRIRSFTLKRGYMVTFAIGKGGWGYSRVFVADQEDLVVNTLPNILDKRISSYRVFQWYNAQKKGLASNGDKTANSALNSSWCYDWAQGNASLLPDVEWVPNHIYEDWPSVPSCGSVTGSCHMKNNNEPANSADDHPQTVKEVLDNWENIMRTGLRLCSPSTHDGGWNWHNEFMNEIDARGWRCDIVDFHGYWDGEWGSLDWRIDEYGHGRPVWFSEWVWGASWNNNGIFKAAPDGKGSFSKANQQKCYDGTKPILDRLNDNKRVERYAYWNSEADASKIYKDGTLSILGTYYAKMNSGLGYNASIQKIPNETRMEDPKDYALTYDAKTGKVTIKWNDPNGELSTSMIVQRKMQGDIQYTNLDTIAGKDKSGKTDSYIYNDYVTEPGVYLYRIKTTFYNGKSYQTDDATVNVAPAQGTDAVQYGKLSIENTKAAEVIYSEAFDIAPNVFIGTVTNKNAKLLFGNNTSAMERTKFTFQMLPWLTNTADMTNNEDVPFLALKPGNYKFGDIDCEVGTVKSAKSSSNIWTDEAEVTFAQPFPEGVKPIVLTEIKKPGYITKTAMSVRVFDVTNKGFKFIVYSEDKSAQKILLTQTVNYLAIAPGFDYIDRDNGIMIAAGHSSEQIYGIVQQTCDFTAQSADNGEEQQQLKLYSPAILTALQTNNYPVACTLRRTDVIAREDGVAWTTGTKVKRTLDHAITDANNKAVATSTTLEAYRDNLGWVAVAAYREGGSVPACGTPDAIREVNTTPAASSNVIYNLQGQRVNANAKGIVIVGGKKYLRK